MDMGLYMDSSYVILDDANFHDSVDLSEFESKRCLLIVPPEGYVSFRVCKSTPNYLYIYKFT